MKPLILEIATHKLSAVVPKIKNRYKSHMTIITSPIVNKNVFSEPKEQKRISVY